MSITEAASVYIPMDRRQALAHGSTLPERTQGAALFADISGFTPLTEALAAELGPQRGAEELVRHLDLVYEALIAALDGYGGSVIGFSGDAITCWFDGDDGLRATACSLAMQQVMRRFATVTTTSGHQITLSVKVAVAVGPLRRFLVGDPTIQMIDVLAGSTLDRLAAAEHHALPGQVVLDSTVLAALGGRVETVSQQTDPESGLVFGVACRVNATPEPSPWPPLAEGSLSEEQVRPWVLPAVYERLRSGYGEFLAELRPAVALFLRFSGLDYDRDEAAGAGLDAFVCQVQRILAAYNGTLIQLTLGDKGSYLYAAFGAPVAHENDAVRAVSAAQELGALPAQMEALPCVQIGIARGRMRTGAYGSSGRRTYGVLGDAVNLAARLMQAADPGQTLASQAICEATAATFAWETLPALWVKGKSAPVAIGRLIGRKEAQTVRLQEPVYLLPMVGREEELELIGARLKRVLAGQGQVIGITAEAGMGKSRLVAEVIRLAKSQGLAGFGGECQSYGTHTSYLVWRDIWWGFFGLQSTLGPAEVQEALTSEIARLDEALLGRLPLLGVVLNVVLPENDVTRDLDPKLRKGALETLLAECLRARAREGPLLFVLEDCHWLDTLSRDLLLVLERAAAHLPVLFTLAYRPPDAERAPEMRLDELANFTEIKLAAFTPDEAERLIRLKLDQFSQRGEKLPTELVERITTRAQGNPFYIEELLNYMRDRAIAPDDSRALAVLDLPDTLQSLVLTRIDQLAESPRAVLRVASVVGRVFKAAVLWDVHPALGQPAEVTAALDLLSRLDLTPLDDAPEQTYLFKHIVTQEVAYDSLPYAMRALLHDHIGQHLERTAGEGWEHVVDLLAHHYDHSENLPKRQEYLRKAGEAAQRRYANAAAIAYYQRVIDLLPQAQQTGVLLKLGQVLELVGQWEDANRCYEQTLAQAETLGDLVGRSQCQVALGEILRKRGRYADALAWYEQAQAGSEQAADRAGVAKALVCAGTLAAQQGAYAAAQARYEQSLAIRRSLDDRPNISNVLNNLGIVTRYLGDSERAQSYYRESLDIRRELHNKWGIANSLNNLGNLALQLGELEEARSCLTEALGLQREIGDRWAIANSLNNLANVTRVQADDAAARSLYHESLTINRALGDRWALAYLLEDIATLLAHSGQAQESLRLAGRAEALREEIGAPLPPGDRDRLHLALLPAREAVAPEGEAATWATGRAMTLEQAIAEALAGLGAIASCR